jgi:hypothetical protein
LSSGGEPPGEPTNRYGALIACASRRFMTVTGDNRRIYSLKVFRRFSP